MPIQKYSLPNENQTKVEISWQNLWFNWKDIAVSLDGQEVGRVPNQRALRKGQKFYLQNESILQVKLVGGSFRLGIEDLKVYLDNRKLKKIKILLTPIDKWKRAYKIIYMIGFFTLVFGIPFSIVSSIASQGQANYSEPTIIGILGGIYLLLGYLVKRKSLPFLRIATTLYGFDTLLYLLGLFISNNPIAGIVALYWRWKWLGFMWKGIEGIRQINSQHHQYEDGKIKLT
ncbi:hypothetical protein [Moorena producens]|uniref:hypothetical protein n=1 Tax=Moorena producens TaxID=1155739 RepID=UPI003C713A1F